MNILILGSSASGAIEIFFKRELERLGSVVCVFDALDAAGPRGLVARIRARLGDLRCYGLLNETILKVAKEGEYDVVWVFKGVEILPKTIVSLRQMGKVVVNYNPDHPFIRTSVAHGGRNVEECVPLYDLYLSYSKSLVEKIPSNGVWLPFGYAITQEEFDQIEGCDEIRRACFVGTVDLHRLGILRRIASQDIPVDIIGPLNRYAKRLVGQANVNVYETRFGIEFWKALRQYRVQLNFFRPHNEGSHNQRTFEVPAAGGLLVTPDSSEQREFFVEDREIFLYKDTASMLNHVERIMSMDAQSAKQVREAARNRSLVGDYSYASRVGFALEEIIKYKSLKGRVRQ